MEGQEGREGQEGQEGRVPLASATVLAGDYCVQNATDFVDTTLQFTRLHFVEIADTLRQQELRLQFG